MILLAILPARLPGLSSSEAPALRENLEVRFPFLEARPLLIYSSARRRASSLIQASVSSFSRYDSDGLRILDILPSIFGVMAAEVIPVEPA